MYMYNNVAYIWQIFKHNYCKHMKIESYILYYILKKLGKPSILSLFLNLFNKFNNTWALMWDLLSKLQ